MSPYNRDYGSVTKRAWFARVDAELKNPTMGPHLPDTPESFADLMRRADQKLEQLSGRWSVKHPKLTAKMRGQEVTHVIVDEVSNFFVQSLNVPVPESPGKEWQQVDGSPDSYEYIESSPGQVQGQEATHVMVDKVAKDRCVSCGHQPACGYGTVNGDRYCHTDDHSCYTQKVGRS